MLILHLNIYIFGLSQGSDTLRSHTGQTALPRVAEKHLEAKLQQPHRSDLPKKTRQNNNSVLQCSQFITDNILFAF